MDKHPSIDDLFAKARQQAPVASLAETKAAFLKAVGAPVVKSKLFTSKFRLMLYVITTAALIGIASLAGLKTKTEKTTTSKTIQSAPVVQPETKHADSAVNTASQHEFTPEVNPVIADEQSILEHISELFIRPNKITSSWWYDRSSYRNPLLNDSTEVNIPELTIEEIEATEKQKKSMLKALLKKNKEHYAYIPSGSFDYKGKTVSLQAFYMQTTEVTNLEYRTFLFDLLIQGRKEEFLKAKPDEQMWEKQFNQGMEPMASYYFSHPAYDNYPVVNISREGAELYCKWLTTEYNEYAATKKAAQINDIRLPSRTEWVYAASSCGKYTIYPWAGEFIRNSKGLFLANHKPFEGRYYDDGLFHTGKVRSYSPNDYGLYCLSGNVAEMVYNSDNARSNPGTAGGDWTSDADQLKLYADDPYSGITEARCTIGFRVVTTYLQSKW